MQDFFAHETATIDDGCRIGAGTKIWHYSHIMSGCVLGERCNIGQNVVISPDVVSSPSFSDQFVLGLDGAFLDWLLAL